MTTEKLQALLDSMTIREKVGQLVQCNAGQFIQNDMEITGPEGEMLPAEDLNRVMGSVLTFEDAAQARALQERHLAADPKKIPLLLMLDVIHGLRTTYPIPLAMGCSFDDDLMAECADMARKESAACGVHVTFNPMVDTARDARWGRILETSSEEPLLNSRMGAAVVRATQGEDLSRPENVACCVKHFAAYGAPEGGRDYNTVDLSERTLREVYLPAYKACLDAGARLIMPSFNALNGIPSVANRWLMNRVLREEWGFKGVVISDYNAVGELVAHGVAENLKDAVTLPEGIRALLPDLELIIERGCGAEIGDTDESGIDRAVEAARSAEAVILALGEPENDSGEGRSRATLTLPGPQMTLARRVLAANPNTAVILFNGRPLELTELDALAPAILEMWYPGTEAGNAAARLLFGRANPCGKLSAGMPRSVGQYPMPYNRMNTGRPKPQPDSQAFPFTSCYLDTPNLPLYSFGHGLSYTTFAYESLTLDRSVMRPEESVRVTIRVRNTGERAGKEVVQLYLRDPVASVVRPVQQLIDYRKILLEPGEAKEVIFTVTEEQLRFWDFDCAWHSEPGTFELSTGYADHLLLTQTFILQ